MKFNSIFIYLCLIFYSASSFSQNSNLHVATNVDSIQFYQLEKIKQEVENLKSENQVKPIIKILPSFAGVLTALVAVVGVIISFFKYIKEKRIELEQKKDETKLRLVTKFDSIINNLCAASNSVRAGAAVSLLTFLRPEYKNFHKQIYLILLANLKTELSNNINSLMLKTFEEAGRLKFKEFRNPIKDKFPEENSLELDLTRMNMYRLDFNGMKGLSNVDFSFSKLQHANLVDCIFIRSKGFKTDFSYARLSRSNLLEGRFNESNFEGVQFHESNLISAKLKHTNLKNAEFQKAYLQDAILDGADIRGAKFEQADLNNAFFRKIKYNDADLLSIIRSKNWEKANFSEETKMKLLQLASKKWS
ncbi:pentapeptide repeat-containing protein [Marinilabilia rubra]|uniref:Pentapeptide repeat-containing protein n=1 Tax=Marinilabilia rubra TaxID=2162893 RepID=A0A2U2B5C1_9BACT|nr:pentapeptide repeat-containing protein [Marinilabilia rubra]PWD98234.1 hypothetical protein DDZ16_16500 [Marinilabilia rubra]